MRKILVNFSNASRERLVNQTILHFLYIVWQTHIHEALLHVLCLDNNCDLGIMLMESWVWIQKCGKPKGHSLKRVMTTLLGRALSQAWILFLRDRPPLFPKRRMLLLQATRHACGVSDSKQHRECLKAIPGKHHIWTSHWINWISKSTTWLAVEAKANRKCLSRCLSSPMQSGFFLVVLLRICLEFVLSIFASIDQETNHPLAQW